MSTSSISPSVVPFHRCEHCEKVSSEDQKILRCAGCLTARYCSDVCQKASWNKHKPHCKKLDYLRNLDAQLTPIVKEIEEAVQFLDPREALELKFFFLTERGERPTTLTRELKIDVPTAQEYEDAEKAHRENLEEMKTLLATFNDPNAQAAFNHISHPQEPFSDFTHILGPHLQVKKTWLENVKEQIHTKIHEQLSTFEKPASLKEIKIKLPTKSFLGTDRDKTFKSSHKLLVKCSLCSKVRNTAQKVTLCDQCKKVFTCSKKCKKAHEATHLQP